jgi:hypothetical protein
MHDLQQQQPAQLQQTGPLGNHNVTRHQKRRSEASRHCPYLKAVFRVAPDDVSWGPDDFRDDHVIVGDII